MDTDRVDRPDTPETEDARTVGQTKYFATKEDVLLTPSYSQTPTFSEWASDDGQSHTIRWDGSKWEVAGQGGFDPPECYDFDATSISSQDLGFTATRTRTDIVGYTLGNQETKPLQPKGDYISPTNISSQLRTSLQNMTALQSTDDPATIRDHVNTLMNILKAIIPAASVFAFATSLFGATILDNLALTNEVYTAGEVDEFVYTQALSRAEAEKGFTEWVCEPAAVNGKAVIIRPSSTQWYPTTADGDSSGMPRGTVSSESLTWAAKEWWGGVALTATRIRLRPTSEMEASWDAKASTNDVELTPVYSNGEPAFGWVCNPEVVGNQKITLIWEGVGWHPNIGGQSQGSLDSTFLQWEAGMWNGGGMPLTAVVSPTNIIGYTLGSQTNAALASLSFTTAFLACATTNDVKLTPVYSEPATFSNWVTDQPGWSVYETGSSWAPFSDEYGSVAGRTIGSSELSEIPPTRLVWGAGEWGGTGTLVATRERIGFIGYTLGSQTNSVLASTNLNNQVNADWNATNGLAQILNKPVIPESRLVVTGVCDSTYGGAVSGLSHTFAQAVAAVEANRDVELQVFCSGSNKTQVYHLSEKGYSDNSITWLRFEGVREPDAAGVMYASWDSSSCNTGADLFLTFWDRDYTVYRSEVTVDTSDFPDLSIDTTYGYANNYDVERRTPVLLLNMAGHYIHLTGSVTATDPETYSPTAIAFDGVFIQDIDGQGEAPWMIHVTLEPPEEEGDPDQWTIGIEKLENVVQGAFTVNADLNLSTMTISNADRSLDEALSAAQQGSKVCLKLNGIFNGWATGIDSGSILFIVMMYTNIGNGTHPYLFTAQWDNDGTSDTWNVEVCELAQTSELFSGDYDDLTNKPTIPAPVDVVPPSTNAVDAGKAADAYATGTNLASRATTNDVHLVPVFTAWMLTVSPETHDFDSLSLSWVSPVDTYPNGGWTPGNGVVKGDASSTELTWGVNEWQGGVDGGYTITATRSLTAYHMAGQPTKDMVTPDGVAKVISDAEAEAKQWADWFPGGEAKSIADCTQDLKFDWANATNNTVKVLPFCNTGDSSADNSDKAGVVVIPPYVETNGVRYTVIGVAGDTFVGNNTNLTSIVAPTTVTTLGYNAFNACISLTAASLPAATSIGNGTFFRCITLASISLPSATAIGDNAFYNCAALTSVSLPAATVIGDNAFEGCALLTSVSLPAATSIGTYAFDGCTALAIVDFGPTVRQSIPSLGYNVFPTLYGHTCRIIVPDGQFAAWTADPDWAALTAKGYEFVRWSDTQPATREYVDSSLSAIAGPCGKVGEYLPLVATNLWPTRFHNMRADPATAALANTSGDAVAVADWGWVWNTNGWAGKVASGTYKSTSTATNFYANTPNGSRWEASGVGWAASNVIANRLPHLGSSSTIGKGLTYPVLFFFNLDPAAKPYIRTPKLSSGLGTFSFGARNVAGTSSKLKVQVAYTEDDPGENDWHDIEEYALSTTATTYWFTNVVNDISITYARILRTQRNTGSSNINNGYIGIDDICATPAPVYDALDRLASRLDDQSAILAGAVFDFAELRGIYAAVSNIVSVLGGTVTNYPSFEE